MNETSKDRNAETTLTEDGRPERRADQPPQTLMQAMRYIILYLEADPATWKPLRRDGLPNYVRESLDLLRPWLGGVVALHRETESVRPRGEGWSL